MTSRSASLAKLYEWRHRPYFSSLAVWESRGLIKSPDPVPWNLDSAKNTLVDALLKLTFADADEQRLITMILEHLATELSGKSYDTEEREFLTDCFFQIAMSLELSDFEARYSEWGSSGKFQRRFA